MNKIFKLVNFNIKTSLKYLISWILSLSGLMFLYMILFPSIQDLATTKMEAMPKELLQFMGIESFENMNNYLGYFSMIFNIILIAIIIFGCVYLGKIAYKEEKDKNIEFLNSLNVNRRQIYLSKVISSFVATTVVLIFVITISLVCGLIVGNDTFVLSDFIIMVKVSSFTAYFFNSLSLLSFGISNKISCALIGNMGFLFTYFIGYLGILLQDKAQFLQYLSPIHVFSCNNALKITDGNLVAMIVYILITIMMIVVGMISYNKRDLDV
ncbi:MAG: ABC transporter permease subunit [Erysipelotrichaceae bacterium]